MRSTSSDTAAAWVDWLALLGGLVLGWMAWSLHRQPVAAGFGGVLAGGLSNPPSWGLGVWPALALLGGWPATTVLFLALAGRSRRGPSGVWPMLAFVGVVGAVGVAAFGVVGPVSAPVPSVSLAWLTLAIWSLCRGAAAGWLRPVLMVIGGLAVLLIHAAWSRIGLASLLASSALGLVVGLLGDRLAVIVRPFDWARRPNVRRGSAAAEILLGLALPFWVEPTGPMLAMALALSLIGVGSGLARWRAAGDGDRDSDAHLPDRLILGCLTGGVLLAVLLDGLPWAAVATALQGVPAAAWVAVIGGLWLSYGLRAERLQREWAAWGRSRLPPRTVMGRIDSLSLFLTHNAALVVLPMRAGEAGYPWMLKARFDIPVADSVRSLLWLRLQDTLVLGWLALVLLLPMSWPLRLALGGVCLLLGGLLMPRLVRRLADRSPRWKRWQESLLEHRADRLGWILCLANWLLKLGVLGGLLALLAGMQPWQGWAGAVAGELAAALPLQAPAGLGTYEAAVWAAGQWSGAQTSLPVLAAAALAVHAVSLVTAVLSFAIFRLALLASRATGGRGPSNPKTTP